MKTCLGMPFALAACLFAATAADGGDARPTPAQSERQPETVETDISARALAVTSSFTGAEIIVFGTVQNSRQTAPSDALYDIAVVVEGVKSPLVARRKTRVAGVWTNTEWMRFHAMPSYYAVASTRPLDEIAAPDALASLDIGFDHITMTPRVASAVLDPERMADYRLAVIRLKQREGLYIRDDYGVSFVGSGLFRATVRLPANVPVGPLRARVFLFGDGRLLGQTEARVALEREGVERHLHAFANDYPILYGMLTVLIAVLAGLAATAFNRRGA